MREIWNEKKNKWKEKKANWALIKQQNNHTNTRSKNIILWIDIEVRSCQDSGPKQKQQKGFLSIILFYDEYEQEQKK